MDTKVACLLLIILGALTVQGAVSGNKRTNPLHARGFEKCMGNGEEYCTNSYGERCRPDYYTCMEKLCNNDGLCCCLKDWE